MPTRPHTTTAQQLNAAPLAITNSLADPDIKAAIAQYGYTTTKLNAEKKKIGVTSRICKTAAQRAEQKTSEVRKLLTCDLRISSR